MYICTSHILGICVDALFCAHANLQQVRFCAHMHYAHANKVRLYVELGI